MLLLTQPKLRRWTKAEYHQMADLGFFDGQRVELIGGEVLKMPAQKDAHAAAITLVDYALRPFFASGHIIRIQSPMDIDSESEPEPDVLVVKGTPRTIKRHPKTAVLIVEVSESTLHYDQGRKASLYAGRSIRDYWIVNLVDRQLEIRRRIVPDASEPFDFRYDEITILKPGDIAKPLAVRAEVAIADLLP